MIRSPRMHVKTRSDVVENVDEYCVRSIQVTKNLSSSVSVAASSCAATCVFACKGQAQLHMFESAWLQGYMCTPFECTQDYKCVCVKGIYAVALTLLNEV